MPNFITDFFENRGWLKIPQYVSGRFQVSGTNIDPYEFTLIQFNNLVASDYAGITVRVTNLHTTAAGVGGVLFTGGATWTLESPHIYYATFDLLPLPSLWPGARCLVGSGIGVGGAVVVSRQIGGTYYWRYASGRALVDSINADILFAPTGSNYTNETLVRSFAIPINNLKSIMQIGDFFEIRSVVGRTASVTTFTRCFRLGTAGTVSDTFIEGVTTAAGQLTSGEFNILRRNASNKVIAAGPQSANKWAGTSGSAPNAEVTVTDLDSATSYLHLTLDQSANTSEGVALKDFQLHLVHAAG